MTTSPASTLAPAATLQPLIGSDYSFSYAPARRARQRFPHLPALDGLRGLAVAAVLAFHAGWRFTSGGFLGVSTFFTLSGFLITARLVHEHTQTDSINLRAFWGRRVRRLIPAAVLAVALVVALAAWVVPAFRTNLIGDVTAALTEVANWRFWIAGRSYAALFRQPSPLLHFWSLAIEEQFYVVFPIVVWFVVVKLRKRRSTLTAVVASLTVACTLASLWAGVTGRHTLAYYGTPMRAAEILTGALLALLPIGQPSQQAPSRRAKFFPFYALVACVSLWMAATPSQPWLDRGGLPAYSLLSAIVIAGCIRPGPIRNWLSARPLQWLGRISYGVYLYHWPIYQWLSPRRVGWSAAPLFAMRIVASVAAAVLSYYVLEQPILRSGRRGWTRARRLAIPLGATMTAVVASAMVIGGSTTTSAAGFQPVRVTPSSPPLALAGTTTATSTVTTVPSSETVAATATTSAAATATTATPATPATTAAPPVTLISMFGDSTAMMVAAGLRDWAKPSALVSVDAGGTMMGCGVGRGGRVRIAQFGENSTNPECDAWERRWAAVLAKHPADIAAVLVSPWDVTDRIIPGDDQWRAPGDPVYDAYLKKEMLAVVDFLSQRVKTVAWLTSPIIDFGRGDPVPPVTPYPVSDPARMRRFDELLAQVAAERPNVHLVDLVAFLQAQPDGELGEHLRPDGVHFTEPAATEVAAWLGPELLHMAGDAVPSNLPTSRAPTPTTTVPPTSG